MKPSELIQSWSPKGYIDTAMMYACNDPRSIDIYNAYSAGVAPEVMDKVEDFSFIELDELENDYSLIKKIKHPGQIIGGYSISKDLAETLQSYFGRKALLESGRPVNSKGFYTREEILDSEFIKMGLFRSKRHRLYLYTPKPVGLNRNNDKSLNAAKKAYELELISKRDNINDIYNILGKCGSGSIVITYDSILSLDSFTITAKMIARELHAGNAIEINDYPDLNTEYKKYKYKGGSIPSNYCLDSGRAYRSLFEVYINNYETPDKWEDIGNGMYSASKEGQLVATVLSKSNEKILEEKNKTIDRINNMYNTSIPHVILSSIGDFFFPALAAVSC